MSFTEEEELPRKSGRVIRMIRIVLSLVYDETDSETIQRLAGLWYPLVDWDLEAFRRSLTASNPQNRRIRDKLRPTGKKLSRCGWIRCDRYSSVEVHALLQNQNADNTEYWILNTEYWILNTEYWILNTEYWILNTVYWILNTEFNTEYWIQNS